MRKLIYSMGVSLDGFIADADGEIDWTAPDEELHRFHNEQGRETGMHLYGRRLYETMAPWETRDQDPDAHEAELEFAAHLEAAAEGRVLDDARVGRGQRAARPGRRGRGGRAAEGGAGGGHARGRRRRAGREPSCERGSSTSTACSSTRSSSAAGTPFFPPLDDRIPLDLVETRTFGSRVVYLRYAARRDVPERGAGGR